jgi:hypothetical protein
MTTEREGGLLALRMVPEAEKKGVVSDPRERLPSARLPSTDRTRLSLYNVTFWLPLDEYDEEIGTPEPESHGTMEESEFRVIYPHAEYWVC